MDVIEPFYFSEKIDSRISFVKSDLTELKQIKDILKNNIDTIFHLASVVSADAEENLDKAMKVNVVGILNLLNASSYLRDVENVELVDDLEIS